MSFLLGMNNFQLNRALNQHCDALVQGLYFLKKLIQMKVREMWMWIIYMMKWCFCWLILPLLLVLCSFEEQINYYQSPVIIRFTSHCSTFSQLQLRTKFSEALSCLEEWLASKRKPTFKLLITTIHCEVLTATCVTQN